MGVTEINVLRAFSRDTALRALDRAGGSMGGMREGFEAAAVNRPYIRTWCYDAIQRLRGLVTVTERECLAGECCLACTVGTPAGAAIACSRCALKLGVLLGDYDAELVAQTDWLCTQS